MGSISRLLLLLCLLLCQDIVLATTYYFSSTNGNDTFSNLQAQNPATPWRSIDKLNSIFSNLRPGDSVLLKRGDSFYGSIRVGASGAMDKHIVIAAFGTGAAPLVTGFVQALGFTGAARSGKFQTFISQASGTINVVTVNGQPQQIGRYPNANASNGGYLTYQRLSDSSIIVDTTLTSATNWTGAEVVIRKKLWVLDRCRVLAHRDSLISYINPTGSIYDGTANYGYFFQNDLRTLDQDGEWYFDPITKKLTIFFSNWMDSRIIRVATQDVLLSISNYNYITVAGIQFEGANQHALFAGTSDFITIKNCTFNNAGSHAIYMVSVSDVIVEQCAFSNLLNNAIRLSCSNDSNIAIKNCSIQKVGIMPGMGQSGANTYKGILVECKANLLVERNTIDSVGYTALEFSGSNVIIRNNMISAFCFVKDDGGGIYSYVPNTNPPVTYTNRLVHNNIIRDGIGAPNGRASQNAFVSGIYLDGKSSNIVVQYNTVMNVAKNGIHCNNPMNVALIGNTCFNTLNAISFMRWPWATLSNFIVKRNVLYPKRPGQRVLYYTDAALTTPAEDNLKAILQSAGNIDSNYYGAWNEPGCMFECYAASAGTPLAMSPKSPGGWRAFTGHDAGSFALLREIPAYKLNGLSGNNLFANGTFNSNTAGIIGFGANYLVSWDGANQISGGALKLEFTAAVANRYVLLHAPIGAVQSGKKYIFRYTTKGSTAFGITRAYLRKTGVPYNNLVPTQVKTFGNGITTHEFLFCPVETEAAASFVIEFEQNSGTTYIDNVGLYEADAEIFAIDDVVRIEYNPTAMALTVPLNGAYIGTDATYYNGEVKLPPFTSKVLVKDTSIIREPLSLKLDYLPITCFGTSTTVQATATGGIPPYRGQGSYSVLAGSYTYSVSDLRGVSVSGRVSVPEPDPLNVSAVAALSALSPGETTTVTVRAVGGTPPYQGTGSFTNIAAGTHSFTITDAAGCQRTKVVNIHGTGVLSGTGALEDATGAIAGIRARLNVQLSPNPSTDEFLFTSRSNSTAMLNVAIFTASMLQLQAFSIPPNQPYRFGRTLRPGIYFMRVTQAGLIRVLKFIKTS